MKRALCILAVVAFAGLAFAQSASKSSSTDKKAYKPPTKLTLDTSNPVHKYTAQSIEVLEFRPADIKVPAQFEMAMYENTIRQLEKLKKFKHVYRDGDKRAAADPGCVKLQALIWEFKEGSARQRQVTTVKGATVLHVTVHIANAKGEPLLDKDVGGSVHFIGENLRATQNLANNIATLVNQNFD